MVSLSNDHILFVISFKESKKSLIISDFKLISKALNDFINDDDLVIASGSTKDSMIVFLNTERKVILGYFTEEGIKPKDELRIYNSLIYRVTSACYVKSRKELLYLYDDGKIGQFSLDRNKNLTSLAQVPPTLYKTVSISECERFIIMLSYQESYLYTTDLCQIYMDYTTPFFAGVKDSNFYFIFFDSNGKVTFKIFPIDVEKKIIKPDTNSIYHKVDSGARKTILLAKEIIKGVFESNNFRSIDPNKFPNN